MTLRCLATACCLLACLSVFAYSRISLPQRLIYCSTNLGDNASIEPLLELLQRAAHDGYTGILLSDSYSPYLYNLPSRYYLNAQRVKETAARLHLEIIPAVFPVGYAGHLLYYDPNLAEGMPVRDALFVVKNGEAQAEADPAVAFKDGGFSVLSQWAVRNDEITTDNGAVRITPTGGRLARLAQVITVQPFHQYHISVRIRTEGLLGRPFLNVSAPSQPRMQALILRQIEMPATQDWTVYDLTFNSLEHNRVFVELGCQNGQDGTLWFTNIRIDEAGLLNIIRRPGEPLVVKREDDGKVLTEGIDYEEVFDPLLGTQPGKGRTAFWHQPPAIKTSLPDGTRLRVSYTHAVILYRGQVSLCPSEPKSVEVLRDAFARLDGVWDADAYCMSHDEIRVFNQDQACRSRGLDAGQILADNVRTCIGIIRAAKPNAHIYVWSDMFDPNHNARSNYYLVNGDLSGSWKGLDRNVTVMPWYFAMREKSMHFFADHGFHQLIAGYYDADPERIRDWLDTASQFPRIDGVMYTTWKHQFTDLERFQQVIDDRVEKQ